MHLGAGSITATISLDYIVLKRCYNTDCSHDNDSFHPSQLTTASMGRKTVTDINGRFAADIKVNTRFKTSLRSRI